jgi:hypothetical protein
MIVQRQSMINSWTVSSRQKRMILQVVIFEVLAAMILFSGACLSGPSRESRAVVPEPSPANDSRTSANISAKNSSFCKIDFANFSYPAAFDEEKQFTLVNGTSKSSSSLPGDIVYELNGVYFGDVTGDAKNEVIVVVDIITGGSSMPRSIYVFEDVQGAPRFLWSYTSGDRADGGLKSVSANRGLLIIETYLNGDKGDCCPTHYESKGYKWTGTVFAVRSTAKFLNASGAANFGIPESKCN